MSRFDPDDKEVGSNAAFSVGVVMEFTGERIVPGRVNDDLLNEHHCRYRFAQLLVEGKLVLDIGSGVGYGAKILAETASEVLAVDLSEEAVRYADREYAAGNVEMVVGDAQDLPLASDSVDVVVSFELVEHLQGQQAHLLEMSRVLKPEGLTVISTPNRIFYSQESNQANPFHTREFDFQEFYAFLTSVFSSVEVYFQNHIAGLIIGNPSLYQRVTTYLEEGAGDLETTSNYFVAICSRDREYQPALGNFCLLPGTGNLLRERQQNIQRLEEEVSRLDSALTRLQGEYEERSGWALQLNRQVKSRDGALIRLREEFEERSRFVKKVSNLLEARDKALGELRSEFEDRTRWAEELSSLLEARDKALGELRTEFEDRTRWAQELSSLLKSSDKALGELRSEFENRTRWAQKLSSLLEARDKALGELRSEFEDRTRWAQELSNRLQAREEALGELRSEFEDRTRWAEELSNRLQAREEVLGELRSEFEDRTRWAEELSSLLEARDKALGELRSEFEDRTRWAKELSSQLIARDEAQLRLQSEFEDRTEWALRLDAELQRSDAELQQARLKLEAIKNSRLYKLVRLLGWKLKV